MSKPKIAVVDENRGVREGVLSQLQDVAEVHLFANAEAFQRESSASAFEGVFADAAVAHALHLRLLREGVTTPVVYLAGAASVSGAVEAIKLGAVDYLVHPISGDVLLKTLDAALRQKRTGVPDRFFHPEIELDAMLDVMEREMICSALLRSKGIVGGRNGAAVMLGVTRTGLLYKMKRLGISRATVDAAEGGSEDSLAQESPAASPAASSSTNA